VDSINARAATFNLLAEEHGVDTYDGWDVGIITDSGKWD